MAEGIVTHIDRARVDVDRAVAQHAAYVAALAGAGWTIHEVAPAEELPDSAFVEDTVIVCENLAVLTRPGASERRAEVAGSEQAARELGLEIARIEAPGRLDGGDVIVDLQRVSFVDSTGLAVLLNALRRLTRARRRMGIVIGNSAVRRAFEVTRLHWTFDVFDDVQSALDGAAETVTGLAGQQ